MRGGTEPQPQFLAFRAVVLLARMLQDPLLIRSSQFSQGLH